LNAMKDFVLQDDLPISVEEFWNLFFKEDEFTLIFHEKRGDSDTQVGAWTVAPEGRKQRVVRFLSPTASNSTMRRIAGVTTQIKEIQLCYFSSSGSFHIQCKTLFEKTSLVEIDCKMLWEVSPSAKGCQCTIKCSNEYKGKLFKDAVEAYVSDEKKDACEQWLALAHEKISDYLPDIQYQREEAATLQQSQVERGSKGDESEEEPSPPPKKEAETINESERERRESAVERAKRIISHKATDSEEETDDEDATTTESSSEEDEEEEEEDIGFYDTNDELSTVARLDQATTVEEKLALLQAYSRAMQVELAQMKELMILVQTRMMRLETPGTPSTPRHSYRNGKTPLSESGNGFNSTEEMRYRDLAIQRSIANTQRRIEELEETIASRLPPPGSECSGSGQEVKRRGLLPILTSNTWLVNVPFIVFVICWPFVSNKVSSWGVDWGSRFLLQLQRLVLGWRGSS